MHEQENLFLQCTSCGGSTAAIVKEWMRSDILALGTGSIAEAQLDLFLAHSPSSRKSSPWLLFLLLQYLAGQRVHWDEILENEGADDLVSMISLSFSTRLRSAGKGLSALLPRPLTSPGNAVLFAFKKNNWLFLR